MTVNPPVYHQNYWEHQKITFWCRICNYGTIVIVTLTKTGQGNNNYCCYWCNYYYYCYCFYRKCPQLKVLKMVSPASCPKGSQGTPFVNSSLLPTTTEPSPKDPCWSQHCTLLDYNNYYHCYIVIIITVIVMIIINIVIIIIYYNLFWYLLVTVCINSFFLNCSLRSFSSVSNWPFFLVSFLYFFLIRSFSAESCNFQN